MENLSKLDDVITQLENDSKDFGNLKALYEQSCNLNLEFQKTAAQFHSAQQSLQKIAEQAEASINAANNSKKNIEDQTTTALRNFSDQQNNMIEHLSSEISNIITPLESNVSKLENASQTITDNISQCIFTFQNDMESANDSLSNMRNKMEELDQYHKTTLSIIKILGITNIVLVALNIIVSLLH